MPISVARGPKRVRSKSEQPPPPASSQTVGSSSLRRCKEVACFFVPATVPWMRYENANASCTGDYLDAEALARPVDCPGEVFQDKVTSNTCLQDVNTRNPCLQRGGAHRGTPDKLYPHIYKFTCTQRPATMFMYAYAHANLCVHTCMHACLHACMHARACIRAHMYIHIYLYI